MGNKYPECEKMDAVQDKSQAIGEFLEWMTQTKRLTVCCDSGYGGYLIANISTEKLLAEFFNIDLRKVEKEKRQMLKEMRGK